MDHVTSSNTLPGSPVGPQAWTSWTWPGIRPLAAWLFTFKGVLAVLNVGFGPLGIISGSLAAGFQSFMYGGFTPAGGIFAILTSLGMRGILQQVVGILAAGFATGIAFLVGRST
ncbi:hypothetical protein POX_a01689 [Penicillium oxalicum]|uniref:hypothetical protein n=1 Tax=Penicillium oxalicum TaxID=69781 RepID=UPI0020B7C00D|nr:hypothetical protein POX_a01689 [Penicillium oxalicum]KAI2795085.1 hypothetical protein POX_a01689 [Penicillium oxalicum]